MQARFFRGHRRVASLAFAYLRPKEISEGDAWRWADRCTANRTVPTVQRFPRANDSSRLPYLVQTCRMRSRWYQRLVVSDIEKRGRTKKNCYPNDYVPCRHSVRLN